MSHRLQAAALASAMLLPLPANSQFGGQVGVPVLRRFTRSRAQADAC